MTNQRTSRTAPPLIFIVDDDDFSRQMLDDTLSSKGHATRTFSSGKLVLHAVQEDLPDLILLDIIMPEMDGFEVCRHLKENDATRYIPVVLVTSLNEKSMMLKGIAAGADDFISKPYNATEILLRTRNLLMVKRHHDFIKEHSGILEHQVRLRTEELEKVIAELKSTQQQMMQQEKMATIGQLTAGIANELNNPIGFIASNIATFEKYCDRLLKFMESQQKALLSELPDPEASEKLQSLRKILCLE